MSWNNILKNKPEVNAMVKLMQTHPNFGSMTLDEIRQLQQFLLNAKKYAHHKNNPYLIDEKGEPYDMEHDDDYRMAVRNAGVLDKELREVIHSIQILIT